MFALTICIFVFVPFTFSLFWRSLLHSLLVFCQHCSLFFLYWQWISLKYTVFIVLSVVYIWGVISYNTLLSKSVQIKFRMFIIHTNFLSFLQFMMILIFYLVFQHVKSMLLQSVYLILTVSFTGSFSVHTTVSCVHFGCN